MVCASCVCRRAPGDAGPLLAHVQAGWVAPPWAWPLGWEQVSPTTHTSSRPSGASGGIPSLRPGRFGGDIARAPTGRAEQAPLTGSLDSPRLPRDDVVGIEALSKRVGAFIHSRIERSRRPARPRLPGPVPGPGTPPERLTDDDCCRAATHSSGVSHHFPRTLLALALAMVILVAQSQCRGAS